MTNKRYISSVFTLIILLVLASCNGGKKTKEPAQEEVLPEDIVEMRDDQIKLAQIETGNIETRALSNTLKVNGLVTVAPQNLVSVCMPIGGYIKTTSLMPGSVVNKGQTLAVIESQDLIDVEQNYLEAKFKLEYAEAEYKRYTDLHKEEVYSDKSVQSVTADYKSLKAQVKALEQKLELIGIDPKALSENNITRSLTIVSPIKGSIKNVNVNSGKFMSPSDVMFEIENGDKLLLELTLFEKDADKVSVGQKIRFFINNETEQHDATVCQTGKSVNDDKTYRAFATVQSKCQKIIPGMYVNALIEFQGSEVTSVPSGAVVSFDDKDYIFVYERDKQENGRAFTEYRMIEVEKGISDGGYTGVTLPQGFNIQSAKVVVKGAYNLLSAKKNAGEMAC